MLSGGQGPVSRLSGSQVSEIPALLSGARGPGAMLSGFQAFRGAIGPGARLSGIRGPGARVRFCF